MQETLPVGPAAMNDASPLESDQPASVHDAATPSRGYPGRGHKMQILDDAISAMKSRPEESPLVKRLKDWIDKAAAVAHVAVDRTASSVAPLSEAAVAAKDATVAKAQEFKGTAAVSKDQWIGEARATIKERPLTALALAVVAGAALSLIFSSPSDPDDE